MKVKSEKLIQKAKESLAASQLLAEKGFLDIAGSRAYYAMFYIAEAFLWEKDLSFSSHAAVIGAFGREFAKPGLVPVEFHRFLIAAQNKRTKADYEVDEDLSLTNDAVQTLIDQARQFITLAETTL